MVQLVDTSTVRPIFFSPENDTRL